MHGLRTRQAEIEEAIFARVRSVVHDPATSRRVRIVGDAEYVAGLVAAAADHVLDEIERGELERVDRSPEWRRVALVRRLLDGELVDVAELDYALDTWHLGVVGTGVGVGEALQGSAGGLDCQMLSVAPDERGVWAWLGGPREAVAGDLERLVSTGCPAGVSLAFGEPARGIEGWRLTHRQAQEALGVAVRGGAREGVALTRYADVALLAHMLRDEERARELVELYLAPLDGHRCAAATLRKTLYEYFAAGRNSTAAARALSISRRTMRNRMVLIEQSLGGRLRTHQAELELALRLDGLGPSSASMHTVGS